MANLSWGFLEVWAQLLQDNVMNPILFPTTLSDEEHALKEIHEKLKQMRRLLAERKSLAAGEVCNIEKNRVRKSVEDAAFATEELKRKVIAGAITVKKVNEKHTFKRAKIDKKARTTSVCEEGEIDSSSEAPSSPSNPNTSASSSADTSGNAL